jgi:deoxyribodipyrimidine photo-lyase
VSLAIVWFRRDLRLADNPALAAARAAGHRILPVFIHAPDEEAPWQPGAASNWWLHHALVDLSARLDGRLLVRRGPSLDTLRELVRASGAVAVYWNRLYEPALIVRDTEVKQGLRADGITGSSHNAALLFEPWELATRQGDPYRVFTPFWKRLLEFGLPDPEPDTAAELSLAGAGEIERLGGLSPAELDLLPGVRWDDGLAAAWQPTRAAAEARLDQFVTHGLADYAEARDRPGHDGVSRLSPWLHFGQLGPRELVAAARRSGPAASAFLRELGWREFAHHLLYHFPDTPEAPLDPRFGSFPWIDDRPALQAWQRGNTGIPLIDAGMRELWQTGWMHNRVRMVVASLLTKNMLQPWQSGARWFWDTLVDADLANNTLGWQWTAGCGADAAPYFRVFNPVLQGERFDPDGRYVASWVPELAALAPRWIHRPWDAPASVLDAAGLARESRYRRPSIDLKATRERALAAWSQIR